MDCFLCLESKLTTNEHLTVNSATWHERNIQSIIEKHLWPMEISKRDGKLLCLKCWSILDEFHKFYTRIENAQSHFENLMKTEFGALNITEVHPNKCPNSAMSLEKRIILLKDENKYVEIEHEDKCNNDNDDDIPLILMCHGVNKSHVFIEKSKDALNKDPLIRQKINSSNKIKRNSKKGKASDVTSDSSTNGAVIHEPDKSQNWKPSATSCPFLIPSSENKSPPRYYYNSDMNVSDHDGFISQHFKLTCTKCRQMVDTFSDLHQHFFEKHKKKQGYVICCGIQFRKRGMLVNHINLHLNPDYFKCEYCPEVLSSRTTFKVHKKTHGIADKMKSHGSMHACNLCPKKFKNKGLLHSHKLTHIPEEEKKFTCLECNKNFAREHMLTSHQRIVHLKTYSKLCDICGEYISKVESFKRHMEKHEGISQPILSCQICGRLMGSKHCLSVHMKSIHPEDGKHDYVCHICHKLYPNKIARREHIRRVHRTGLIYKCTICEKAFKRKDYLKDHVATHTGVGLPTCPYCSKTFNSNSTMHQHRKKSHPKEWEEARIKKYSGKLPPATNSVIQNRSHEMSL